MSARDELDAVLKLRGLNDRERRAALDAYRAEVLDEQTARDAETMLRAADWLEGIGQHHAAEMLRYEAAGDERDTQPADFFQPGRTYLSRHDAYTAPELIIQFRVEHVTRHPERGHRRAFGWTQTAEPGSLWRGDFRDEDEFTGWTETSEAGEPRG